MPFQNFNPSKARGYGWVPPCSPSPYVLVLLLYLEATENWDHDALMSLFDDSLQHWTLPRSLNRPLLNKRQYGEYLKVVRPTFSTFKVTVNEVIEAENKMSVHASLQAESVKGTVFSGEYILIFHFMPKLPTDDIDALPKICLVKEFIDSAASAKFYIDEKAAKVLDQEKAGRK